MASLDRIRDSGEEAELIRTVRSEGASALGRRAADRLLRPYQRLVYLWCYRYAGDHDQALDLAQDVFIRALRGLASFEGRSSFSLWLFAIARNRCLSAVRRPEPVDDVDLEDLFVYGADSNPGQQLEEREAEEKLLALIRRTLDPTEQKAVWMRCVERMPVDAITDVLGIEDKSGARGLLQRARRKLRAARNGEAREEEGS